MSRPNDAGHPPGADHSALADEALMSLAHDGDARALEVIFDRHSGAAFSLAYWICGRHGVAEDAVQEAFLSVWRGGPRYERARGSVRSWLLGIVRHRAIDLLRREAVRSGRDVSDDLAVRRMPAADRTELEAERRDEAGLVRGALGELPAEQREVIELAYFSGFSHRQIAELLELPPGTVKGRLRLGLSKLQGSLAAPQTAR